MSTLTKARIAQLCTELRRVRVRTIALSERGHEYGPDGLQRRCAGLEMTLIKLVNDLAGPDAMRTVNDVLDVEISPDEVAAYLAERAATQRTLLAAAAAPSATTGASA